MPKVKKKCELCNKPCIESPCRKCRDAEKIEVPCICGRTRKISRKSARHKTLCQHCGHELGNMTLKSEGKTRGFQHNPPEYYPAGSIRVGRCRLIRVKAGGRCDFFALCRHGAWSMFLGLPKEGQCFWKVGLWEGFKCTKTSKPDLMSPEEGAMIYRLQRQEGRERSLAQQVAEG